MLLSVLLPRKGKFRGRYSALFPNAEDRRWVFSPSLSLSSLSRACEKPWASAGGLSPGRGGGAAPLPRRGSGASTSPATSLNSAESVPTAGSSSVLPPLPPASVPPPPAGRGAALPALPRLAPPQLSPHEPAAAAGARRLEARRSVTRLRRSPGHAH